MEQNQHLETMAATAFNWRIMNALDEIDRKKKEPIYHSLSVDELQRKGKGRCSYCAKSPVTNKQKCQEKITKRHAFYGRAKTGGKLLGKFINSLPEEEKLAAASFLNFIHGEYA